MRRDLIIGVLLAAATVAVYLPVAHYEFLNYDDYRYVTNNPLVGRGLTLDGVAWAVTAVDLCNWHPLTWLSHMLDVQLFGPWAGGHHLTNLALHVANTLLIYLVLRRLTAARWPSALVAALFALHPLHIQSVAWVAERKDVLCTFFALLALWAYARYAERPSLARYVPVFVLLALGLASKPMLVTLPLVMLLLDFWPLRRLTWSTAGRRILEKLPLLALSAAASVITMLAQQAGGAVMSIDSYPLGNRVVGALVAYAGYIGKMFWPTGLIVHYPRPEVLPLGEAIGAAALLVAVTALVLWQVRRRPYLAVGWFWYLGTLVPVIGVVQVGEQAMADRYTYIPLIGLFIMIAWGLADLVRLVRWRQVVAAAAATAAIVACIFSTRAQLPYWANSIALFERAVAVSPSNCIARCQLGLARASAGKIDEALIEFRRAVEDCPSNPVAHNNLARLLVLMGRMDEGLAHFREAVAIVPENVQYRANLASALVQAGRPTEAIAECQEALRLAPDFAKAHLRLGLALASLGRFEEALREYREALRLQPDLGEAYNNIGLVMTLKGRLAEAEVAYREALRYQPELTEVHDNLANTLVNLGRPDEALAHYGEALRGQPDAPNVLNDLAWVRATYPDARFRNASEALALSGRACELTHGERPDYLDVLAASLAEAGRFEDAIRVAEQARALAEATGRKDVVAVIEGRLKFYRANQPYRMPVPTAAKAASAEEAAMAGKPAATPGR